MSGDSVVTLADIEGYKDFNSKISGIFTSDKCTMSNLDIASMFEPKKKIKIDENTDLYLYSDNSSLLLHYYVSFGTKQIGGSENISTIVIASRLDNYDKDYSDKNTEVQSGGNAEDDIVLQKVINFMESLNGLSNVNITRINDVTELNPDFLNSAKDQFKTYQPWKSKPTTMYTKYELKDDVVNNEDYKTIFAEEGVDLATFKTKTYYFKVLFKGFQYKNNFYFEKSIRKKRIKKLTNYTGPLKLGESPGQVGVTNTVSSNDGNANNGPTSPLNPRLAGELRRSLDEEDEELIATASPNADDIGGSDEINTVPSNGGNRKLKRRELNTMSLNELKQLHRNNGINMNSNKTVNALINNYIKHH